MGGDAALQVPVLGEYRAEVLDAGLVAVRQEDGIQAGDRLGENEGGQAGHPAAKLDDPLPPVEDLAALLETVRGHALLGRPDADVTRIVEADKVAGAEVGSQQTDLKDRNR